MLIDRKQNMTFLLRIPICLNKTIYYRLPVDKSDDLAQFDSSVVVDRTQGTISARCDKEANNLLPLHLINDIVTGKKSVEEARAAFGEILKRKDEWPAIQFICSD